MKKNKALARLLCRRIIFLSAIALTLISVTWGTTPRAAVALDPAPKITQEMVALKTSEKRWIEINLSTQRLIAWEGKKPVYAVMISTGKEATPTLRGVFSIYSQRRLDRMRGADYDVPDVPYAMYYDRGYAIHGAYWHNRFGTPVSHGCINVAVDHAQWLFNWASVGTPVVIHR